MYRTATPEGDGRKFLIAVNRISVAKRLSVRSAAGRLRKIADATSLQTYKEWKTVIRQDPCAYCNGPGGTVDHITPLALGGAKDSIRNWTGACLPCNLERGPRGLLHFLADADDPRPAERAKEIKKRRAAYKHDIGPEIRDALDGITDKADRRRIAGAIMKRHRTASAERKLGWLRLRKKLHVALVGEGQASSDDPTAALHRRNTRFGRLNDPGATDRDQTGARAARRSPRNDETR